MKDDSVARFILALFISTVLSLTALSYLYKEIVYNSEIEIQKREQLENDLKNKNVYQVIERERPKKKEGAN